MLIGAISLYDPIEFPETDQFIFSITAYHVKVGKKYPKDVQSKSIGYFDSLDYAENYLRTYCLESKRGKAWERILHHFEIEKLPLNSELVKPLGYWVYLNDGTFFQGYPDVDAPFLGIRENDRLFQEQNIVELMADGQFHLAIIATTPLTPGEVKRRTEKRMARTSSKEFEVISAYDFTDYTFNTISYEKGVTVENIVKKRGEHFYDHSHGLNLFPLPRPVGPDKKKVLESFYHLYYTPAGQK